MTRCGFHFLEESTSNICSLFVVCQTLYLVPYTPYSLRQSNKVGGCYFHFTDQEIKFRDVQQTFHGHTLSLTLLLDYSLSWHSSVDP